jgi:membrane protease YdiL (CAAX protease family)
VPLSSLTTQQTENHPESRIHLVASADLRKLFVVLMCLLATTFLADRLASTYSDRIAHISRWNLAIHYSDTAAGLFLVLQMILVLVAFRVGRQRLSSEAMRQLLMPTSIKPVLWGALGGVIVSIAAFPLLLSFDRHVQFVRLILDNPVSLQTVLLFCLVGVLVPISTEVIFRGIFFDSLERRTNAVVAVILSSLLFAYVWTPFDSGVALILGLACALLYRHFNNLVPGIVCSGFVSIFATLVLFLRLLFRA